MRLRSAFLPGTAAAFVLLAHQVACDDGGGGSPPANFAPPGTSGTSSASSSGASGVVNPANPVNPGGNVDSGPPPNQGTTCDGGVTIGTGTVDQSQLAENGRYYLTTSTGEPTQTFTAGVDGWVTGVEVLARRFNVGTGDTIGNLQMELRSGTNALIGTTTIPLASLPIGTEGATLSSGPGPSYFAFGPTCARLTAGTTYRFRLSLSGVPEGVCGPAGTCTAGRIGDTCTVANNCDYRIGIEFQNNGNAYDAGALSGFTAADVVFRTYVQP